MYYIVHAAFMRIKLLLLMMMMMIGVLQAIPLEQSKFDPM